MIFLIIKLCFSKLPSQFDSCSEIKDHMEQNAQKIAVTLSSSKIYCFNAYRPFIIDKPGAKITMIQENDDNVMEYENLLMYKPYNDNTKTIKISFENTQVSSVNLYILPKYDNYESGYYTIFDNFETQVFSEYSTLNSRIAYVVVLGSAGTKISFSNIDGQLTFLTGETINNNEYSFTDDRAVCFYVSKEAQSEDPIVSSVSISVTGKTNPIIQGGHFPMSQDAVSYDSITNKDPIDYRRGPFATLPSEFDECTSLIFTKTEFSSEPETITLTSSQKFACFMTSLPFLVEGRGATLYQAGSGSVEASKIEDAFAVSFNWVQYYKINASVNNQKTFKIHFLPLLSQSIDSYRYKYYIILDNYQATITSRYVYDQYGSLTDYGENHTNIDIVFIPSSLGANVKVDTKSEDGEIYDFDSSKTTELQSENGYTLNKNYGFLINSTNTPLSDVTYDVKMHVIVSEVSETEFPKIHFYLDIGTTKNYDQANNETSKDYSAGNVPSEFYDCYENMEEINVFSSDPIKKAISYSQPFCFKTDYGFVIEGEENDVYIADEYGACVHQTNVFAVRGKQGALYKIVRTTEASVNIYLLPQIEQYDLNYYFIFNNYNGYISARYQMKYSQIDVSEESQTNADVAIIIGKNGCNIKVKEEIGLLYPENSQLKSDNGYSFVNEGIIGFAPILNFSGLGNDIYDAKLKVQVTGQNFDKFPKSNFYFYINDEVLFYSSSERFTSVEARDYSKGEKNYLSDDYSVCDPTFEKYDVIGSIREITLNKSKNYYCFKTKQAFLIEKRNINLIYSEKSDTNYNVNQYEDILAYSPPNLVYCKINYTFPNNVDEIKFKIFFLAELGNIEQHRFYIIFDNFKGNITSRFVRDDCYSYIYDSSNEDTSTYIDLVAIIGTKDAMVKTEVLNNATQITFTDEGIPNQFTFNETKISMFYPSNSSHEEFLYDTKMSVEVTGMNNQIFPHAHFYLKTHDAIKYNDVKNDKPLDYSRGLRAFLPDEFDDCYSFDLYPEGEDIIMFEDRGKYQVKEIVFTDSDKVKCFKTHRSFLIEGRNTKVTQGQRGNYTGVTEENALGVSASTFDYYYRLEHSDGNIKLHFLPNKIYSDENYFVIFGSFDGSITSKYDYTFGGLTQDGKHDIAIVAGSSGRTVKVQAGNGDTSIQGSDQEVINSLNVGDYIFSSDGLIDFTGIPFNTQSGTIINTEMKVTVTGNGLEAFPNVNFYLRCNSIVNYNVENQSPANYLTSSDDTGLSQQQKMIIAIVAVLVGLLIIGIIIFCIIHKKNKDDATPDNIDVEV